METLPTLVSKGTLVDIIEDIRTAFVAYAATDIISIKTTAMVVDTSLTAFVWMGKFVLAIQEDDDVMIEIRTLMRDDPYLYSRMEDFFRCVRRFARGPVTLKAERLLECQPMNQQPPMLTEGQP